MKVKGLLPIAILAALSLTGCELFNQTSSAQSEQPSASESSQPAPSSESEISSSESESESESSESESSEEIEYGVEIANKQTLLAEWYKGSSRDLDIALTPEANPQVELRNGNLVVTSDDPEVVSVSGLGLTALAQGSATITVTYHDASDQLSLNILDGSAIGRYGAEHAGDLEDPLTNEDALLVAKHANYGGERYYVVGEIASFYHAPGSRQDGACSWFLKPAEEGGEKFEVYKCYKEDGSFLTDDDVWVNGTAVAYGKFTSYEGQYETSSAVFVSCEGNKPQPRQTYAATVPEALAVAEVLADGADSYDYYQVTGYVSNQSGNNYFMTATAGEELVKATSDEAHGSREYYSNAVELYFGYTAPAAEIAAKLLKNAKVTVTMILKNYHGQVENLMNIAADDIEVLEEGQPWVIPEHEVTVAEALEVINGLNDGQTTQDLYILNEVFVTEITEAYSSYGNMSFKVADAADGTDTLVVFRAKTDAETAAKVEVGAQVTIKGNLQKYVKNEVMTPELTGATSITVKDSGGGGDEPPAPVGDSLTLNNTALDLNTTSYAANNGSHTVGGVSFTTNQVMKRNKNGSDSMQWQKANAYVLNTTALPKKVANIVVNYEEMGYNDNNVTFDFGAADLSDGTAIADTQTLTTVKDTLQYTITPTSETYDFLKISNPTGGAHYINSVVINFVSDEEPPVPVELPKPIGNFTGYAVNALDQSNVFVTVALGEEAAFVEVGDLGKFQTTYTYDNETGLVTIVDATFGTITATYDVDNNQLINGTLEGTFAAFIGNNGEMTFTASEHLWNCDGTTEELQALFKRRFDRGSGWEVDTSNSDRFVSVENAIAGTAVQRRGFSGGRVAMVFANDFAEPITVSNIGFWVYNPSANDVTFRMWGYQAAGLGSNFETGNVTAVAGQWTYVRMGFGSKTIYNFQIADFTNSGVAFIFDNICLF